MDYNLNEKLQPLMVSIKCLAYNHEKFIRETLEGFVMQKTNFRFEAIVHDDASTDGTAAIIREYAEKYPDIIRPIYETENQYSKKDGSLSRIMHEACNGKYIAMCEGDDYWTDSYKLQKQVDFLEANQDYVMCSHFWDEYQQETSEISRCRNVKSKTYTLRNLIDEEWLYQPLTVVYRASILQIEEEYKVMRDTVLFYRLLKHGKGFCFPDTMGVYRLHSGGVWTGKSDEVRWLSDFKVREAIYDHERTDDAAEFLLNVITKKPIGRAYLLKRRKELVYIFNVTCRHKGFFSAMYIMAKRLCSSAVKY